MQEEILEQVQNSDKNTDIKYPNGDKVFVGCYDGSVLELSMTEKKPVHDHGKILKGRITSMAKTHDNKTQFVCGWGDFKELDISTFKPVNSIPETSCRICVATHDNKSLITAEDATNGVLIKWSLHTKKELHSWKSGVEMFVFSQNVSYDNKYQLTGYFGGWLSIFDLQKHQTLKNIQALTGIIFPVAFSRDNLGAFISDDRGHVKMIKWQADASSEDDFEFTEEPIKVGNFCGTESLCFSKDEKYLLVGSQRLVSVLVTETREVTKEFELTDYVKEITLIQDGNKAIIAEHNGDLSILDLETLQISSVAKNISDTKGLSKIILL